MNSQSNAIPHSPEGSQAFADIPWIHSLVWCVQRELWENRSIYIAPLVAGGLALLGFLISMVYLPGRMRGALAGDAGHEWELILQPYTYAALLIMGTTLIVAIFYCLDALYGERRDRSILFWKSLPVSDLTVVLAKASIPLLVLPLITFAVTVVTQGIMLLLSTLVLLGNGLPAPPLWSHVSFLRMSMMLFYHLVGIHGLWYAPFYGWLLLVSAWARRGPFLWAALPPLAIGLVDKIAFNTSRFAELLQDHFGGGPQGLDFSPERVSMEATPHFHAASLLATPGLWIGLAVTATFLVAAARLRRYRGPI